MRRILLVFFFLSFLNLALAKEVPFTQEDRDRLIRLEEGQKFLQKQIDDLKISTQKQIDDLRTLMLWGFGILFGGMGILIGLVMWDIRTAISPVVKKTKELEEKSDKMEKVLRSLAKRNPEVEEAMKREGLL